MQLEPGHQRYRDKKELAREVEVCPSNDECSKVQVRAIKLAKDYEKAVEIVNAEILRVSRQIDAMDKSNTKALQKLLRKRADLESQPDQVIRHTRDVYLIAARACTAHKSPIDAHKQCQELMNNGRHWFKREHDKTAPEHVAYGDAIERIDDFSEEVERKAREAEEAHVKPPDPGIPKKGPPPKEEVRTTVPPAKKLRQPARTALIASTSTAVSAAIAALLLRHYAKQGGLLHQDVAASARAAGHYDMKTRDLCQLAPVMPQTNAEQAFVDSCSSYRMVWISRDVFGGIAGAAALAMIVSGAEWIRLKVRAKKRAPPPHTWTPRFTFDGSSLGLTIAM